MRAADILKAWCEHKRQASTASTNIGFFDEIARIVAQCLWRFIGQVTMR
jgi:hypothetical protein